MVASVADVGHPEAISQWRAMQAGHLRHFALGDEHAVPIHQHPAPVVLEAAVGDARFASR